MSPRRGTYWIVARDPGTLELGVAVQSHWFSVGSVVPFAQAGVGACAVQSVPDPNAGAAVLSALAEGGEARDALRSIVAGDDAEAAMRQLGVVDVHGRTAAWTGPSCMPFAGDVQGPGFSAQANMMLREGVPEAMAAAFEGTDGPLAERLLAALDAAEAAAGYERAAQLAPDNDELLFWAGLARGVPDGLPLVREAIARNERWSLLLERLTPEVAPTAADVRAALT